MQACSAEDAIEYGDKLKASNISSQTFAGHFVEVGVHAYTGEVRIRRSAGGLRSRTNSERRSRRVVR